MSSWPWPHGAEQDGVYSIAVTNVSSDGAFQLI